MRHWTDSVFVRTLSCWVKSQSSRSHHRGGGAQHSTLPSSATFSSLGYFRDEASIITWRGDMQSVIGFSVIPKCVTFNDLDWLFRIKFCFHAGLAGWDCATSENNCVKTNRDKHILSAVQQCKSLAGTLVSGSVRFMRYSVGFSRKQTLKDSVFAH